LLARNGTGHLGNGVFYHFIHAVMLFVLAERKGISGGGVVEFFFAGM